MFPVRIDLPKEKIYEMAEKTIKKAREEVQLLMKEQYIIDPDK